jgi:hypothetical protein
VATLANISIPEDTKVIIGFETEVGDRVAFSMEKLCPVLAFYTERDWESACERCISILNNEGAGHTMVIHSKNEDIIREFALKKPVNRILVNTPCAMGAVGGTTNLPPSFTLGCGAIGGSSSSDNIGPLNLINIKRLAYGIKEFERPTAPASGRPQVTLDEDKILEVVLRRLLEKMK